MVTISAIIFLNVTVFVMSYTIFDYVRGATEYTTINLNRFNLCYFNLFAYSESNFNGWS